MNPIGIRARVLLAALMPAAVVAVVLALLYLGVVVRDLDVTQQQRAVALARQLASGAEFALFTHNDEALRTLVEHARAERDVTSVSVLGPQRDPIVAVRSHASAESAYTVLEPVFATEFPIDPMFAAAAEPSAQEAQLLGYVYLELSGEAVARRKRELMFAGLIATLGGLLFGWVVAMRLSVGVTTPILQVSNMIERFGKGELSARLAASRSSPLHALEKGINRMAERIEQNRDELERRVAAATEELRQKKEEAELANESKSRFLAAASHDLRQPIHALRLFVEILRDEVPDEARARHLLARIMSSVDSMSAMFDALLDISRLDAGVIDARIEDFPAQSLLRRLEVLFASVAAQRGLRFRVVPSSAWLHSNPALLDRLLQNLVSNALKYTRAGRVLVGCRRRGGTLSIQVWDTGPGIPAERQAEVFQEFFRLEGLGPDAEKGLGLGLAIVQRISQLLDHPVSLRSSAGRGSMFAVEIPCGAPAAPSADAGAPPAFRPYFGGVRVAAIDDDASILAAMEDLLGRWGCLVTSATSAEALLERLHGDDALDLLICDFRLTGGRNGIDAIARVRQAVGAELPAILVTGDTAPDRLKEASASRLHLLHKPVSPDRLRLVMHELLGGGQGA